MKLINKDALIAEIESWRDNIIRGISDIPLTGRDRADATFEYEILGKLKDSLDFFEVKEVQEATASDRGMAEEIIINLKRVEQDYHIDLTREMEWLRKKTHKL